MPTQKWSEIRKRGSSTEAGLQKARAELEEELHAYSISEIRRSLALTQEQLAVEMGIDQSAVSKLERNSDVSLLRLQSVAAAMGGTLEVAVRIDGVLFPLQLGDRVTAGN
jgi:DNA-binding XRE family transcriptional regulator